MTDIAIQSSNPFDEIKQTDEQGEFWSARDLMAPLGYERWERFEDAVARASMAAANVGESDDHFRTAAKVIEGGRWGTQTLSDLRLTRYGAYLVAMNGDPRKPEIAAAQTYFAVQTRRAETQLPTMDPAALDRRALALMVIEAEDARETAELRARELEQNLATVAPKAEGYDQLMASNGGRLVREVAKVLGWREKELRAFLLEEHLIFMRQATCGVIQYDAYAAYSAHFHPVEAIVNHRYGDCAHYTLTVLPRGIDLIRKRIADRQARMRQELTSVQ